MKITHFILAATIIVCLSNGCSPNPKNKDTENVNSTDDIKENDAVEIKITKIDNQEANVDSIPKVKKEVIVEGTISAGSNQPICILLHPMTTRTWYVQNPATLQRRNDGEPWKWRALIYCGTDVYGLDDKYEIVAYADVKGTVCSAGEIEVGNEPTNLPVTLIYTVQRSN